MPPVDFHLLLVTDRSLVRGRSLASALQESVDAGVPAIQLRERDLSTLELLSLAQQIRALTRDRAVPLIINDRVDLAVALDLDGVHLRASSLPVRAARRVLGAQRLIGRSAHSVTEVQQAGDDGADYVILGPIFETPSKREFGAPLGLAVLAAACRHTSVPVFAIGGITRERIASVRDAGAFGVAMIGGILGREHVGKATVDMLASVRVAWPSHSRDDSHAR
ncbi:MAG: thiamine phosphate synthase [Nitrospiraceae bacterium]|jgi:thiamine-phosphate pyrophosphorylase|nr:thiamine phosphate synthase [Nitrospiraceae bacterium]OQW67677.1 MAG: thiamine-phosphate diphosphorylase [Nitrospira sp. ST-bin5]